jgi:hypothetical protein
MELDNMLFYIFASGHFRFWHRKIAPESYRGFKFGKFRHFTNDACLHAHGLPRCSKLIKKPSHSAMNAIDVKCATFTQSWQTSKVGNKFERSFKIIFIMPFSKAIILFYGDIRLIGYDVMDFTCASFNYACLASKI